MAPRRRIEPSPDQPPLFSREELAPRPQTPGIAVDLNIRARHLGHALEFMGKARQREGFAIATEPDSRHRPPIEEQYRSELGAVMKGAERNRHDFLKDAKWQFAYASGYFALKGLGLVSEEDVKKMAAEDFSNFVSKYFTGANAAINRPLFRKQLAAYTTNKMAGSTGASTGSSRPKKPVTTEAASPANPEKTLPQKEQSEETTTEISADEQARINKEGIRKAKQALGPGTYSRIEEKSDGDRRQHMALVRAWQEKDRQRRDADRKEAAVRIASEQNIWGTLKARRDENKGKK